MELELIEHVKMLDSMFYGITAKNFRVLAYEFAEKNDIDHQFNRESKIAGKEWYRCFMKAHKDIVLRQPTPTSISRAMGFNKIQVQLFIIISPNYLKKIISSLITFSIWMNLGFLLCPTNLQK